MKIKIFLMAIIVCLISYIAFGSFQENEQISSNTFIQSKNAVDESRSMSTLQTPVSANKSFTSVKREALHEHSVNDQTDDHAHDADSTEDHVHGIPKHIKKSLCIDDNDPRSCTVNIENNLEGILLDKTGNMLAEEITTVLDSKNFQQVLEFLSTQKQTNEAFVREDGYQNELDKLTVDFEVASSPLYCSETICAMTIEYEDVESSKSFFRKFFNKSNKGNIFLSQQDSNNQLTTIERVMFFPENPNGVILPQLN